MKLMSAEASRAFTRKVILPLAALVVALLVCAVGGVFLIAEYQTNVAIRQEATLAKSALTMAVDTEIDAPFVSVLQSQKEVMLSDTNGKVPGATFTLKGSKAALAKVISTCAKQ